MLPSLRKMMLATVLSIAVATPAMANEEYTLLTTVIRSVNIPMIVGLRMLEREDKIKINLKDVRSPETVVLAVIDGQGEFATAFSPFYPAVERGATVRGVMELSRPEFVIMAKKEIPNVNALNGVRLASHSPKATTQSLVEFHLRNFPTVKPNVVFMPEGSPARAQALLRGAVDAAIFDLSSAQVVDRGAPGRFHNLVDFTNEPISSSLLVVNTAFAKKRPDVVRKMVQRITESYRRGIADPSFWVRERGDYLKEINDATLEADLRAMVKIFDRDGGLSRLKGDGAAPNLAFQVTAGNLTGPGTKWNAGRFYDTSALEAALKALGGK